MYGFSDDKSKESLTDAIIKREITVEGEKAVDAHAVSAKKEYDVPVVDGYKAIGMMGRLSSYQGSRYAVMASEFYPSNVTATSGFTKGDCRLMFVSTIANPTALTVGYTLKITIFYVKKNII